jgi:hypothetical protein
MLTEFHNEAHNYVTIMTNVVTLNVVAPSFISYLKFSGRNDENTSSLAPSHSNLNFPAFLFNKSDFPFLSRLRDPNTRRCDNTFYSGINLAQKAKTGERDF